MNNWQHSFTNKHLDEHLKKPFFQYDGQTKEVTKFIFDDYANLIWSGDSYGCVSAYDRNFNPYVRQRSHVGGSPVADIMSHNSGILSLSSDSLHLQDRTGITLLNMTSIDVASFNELRTMCFKSTDQRTKVFCAGTDIGSGLSLVDLQRGSLESNIPYFSKVDFIRSSKKLTAIGKQSGSIDLFDPGTNQVIKTFASHSANITSMDIRDYTLVTTGQSNGFYNSFSDPFVNIYDLRTMRQLPPVSFSKNSTIGSGGADFVQLHPVLPTIMVIGSVSGSFDFVDMSNPTLRTQYVHSTQGIKGLSLSPNGDHLGILENDNLFSTWSRTNSSTNFTNTPEMLEYPTFVNDGPLENKSVDDYSYPLSSVGIPYYQEKLLSAWPPVIFKSPGTIQRKIEVPKETVVTKRQKGKMVGSLKLYPYNAMKYGHKDTTHPYISLKDKRYQASSTIITDDAFRVTSKTSEIPPAFVNLPLAITKFATDTFDFPSFNKTPYCGLDNDVTDSYTNSIIQLYRFIPEIANFLVGTLKDEHFDTPLLTDLAHLIDMIERTNDTICRSINFQMSFNDNETAKQMGIVGSKKKSIIDGIENLNVSNSDISEDSDVQKFNKFLLEELIHQENSSIDQNHTLEHCYGCNFSILTKGCCTYGQNSKDKRISSIEIGTNNVPTKNNKPLYAQSILPYIEHSLKIAKTMNKKCEQCGMVEKLDEETIIIELPSILSLLPKLDDSAWNIARTSRNWLAKEFYGSIMKNKPIIRATIDEIRTNTTIYKYELHGYVARVRDLERGDHYVTFTRIYDNELKNFKWYLFNDYLVCEIDESVALDMNADWKIPEVIIYGDVEELRKPFRSVSNYDIDYSILYRDYFSEGIRRGVKKDYELLTFEEAPQPGSLIAIDAEFVVLNNEKCDIDCRGIKTIVESKKGALARISVIRGEGEKFGVPFIDDYIIIEKEIEDYLTKFSGILPGDLNPAKSDKNLVPRYVAYRKIWLLMQLGCVFIGHGLQNDFRHINIQVPKEQIRDTAIYFLQGKRYLSLRYLAYVLLDINVQEGNHDSIEDAYTALVLYRKYQELVRSGMMEQVLNKLYEEGRTTNYKVPFKL
ncbi:PAN2-PAN3 deadenylation complex catalytic subunit PAN2 [Nakaseomyces bracarensis]|uniref:PAN2-PAN3 deadenylation complex catalytic subunit PAN2 n=1 Tax=Nakaseomyces bracarensis TaxID=273131 RepID=A0ABR4NZ09_9SACH